jgi:hypothetical protein
MQYVLERRKITCIKITAIWLLCKHHKFFNNLLIGGFFFFLQIGKILKLANTVITTDVSHYFRF